MSSYQLTRRKALQLSGVGAAGALAGCLGNGDEEPGDGDADADDGAEENNEVHILTDFNNEPWQEYWEEDLVPSWEEMRPDVPLNVEYAGFEGTGEQRLATLMQAGDPPEFYHATISEMGNLVNQGQTMDVTDIVEDLEDIWGGEVMFKSTISPIEDEVHSIPHGTYMGGALNYRADIYDELGLEVPETWAELIENARAIDEAEQFDERGFALPAVAAGKSGSDFSNWLYNSGGWVWDWANNGGDEVELWFDEEHVMPVFEHLQELAQYSPDPSSVNWGSTIQMWVGGRIGQCLMNNAWLCGPSYFAGAEEVALNTMQAPIPIREGADPLQRGWVLVNGTPLFEGSSNPEGAKDFKRYMYGEERHPEVSLMEPMRFLPPYESIIESEAYRNHEFFQIADGYFLERNDWCVNELAPMLESEEYSGVETASTPETLYAGAFNITDEMTNQLIVEGRDPQTVYDDTVERFQDRIEEARDVAAY